jgi:hypothetical protein
VIEFWLENRLLIEVATPAMAQEYLDFLRGAQTPTMSDSGLTARPRPAAGVDCPTMWDAMR